MGIYKANCISPFNFGRFFFFPKVKQRRPIFATFLVFLHKDLLVYNLVILIFQTTALWNHDLLKDKSTFVIELCFSYLKINKLNKNINFNVKITIKTINSKKN